MGLLITLDLIATNVYNSVKAPAKRGFSYVEIWMIGVQIPILLGILEYAILLALKKYYSDFIEANTIVFVLELEIHKGNHPYAFLISLKISTFCVGVNISSMDCVD